MTTPPRSSEDDAVKGTLLSAYTNPLIKEARDRQDEILIERFAGRPWAIADLGCGNGYHGSIFAPAGGTYHGYEVAPQIAELAKARWQEAGLTNARLILGDLAVAEPQENSYDLVWCLYFTPGNLRDRSEDLTVYSDAYLDRNPYFIGVISRFFKALKPGGRMFLTVYKDVPDAEAAQVDFYLNTGQHPVTPPGSRFVATAEQFWSVRWTEASMLSNLGACGAADGQVIFHDLNRIAWLVEIEK
ncbi:MAG: class I SAM-dependent methyltransferase [Acidobacteriota bacterium]|nr:class I SAM-dependent methyltransferase [Acidobacteriota bacterium]